MNTYRKETARLQMRISDFILPFGGKLSADNRWMKLAGMMPWGIFEGIYAGKFKNERPGGKNRSSLYCTRRAQHRHQLATKTTPPQTCFFSRSAAVLSSAMLVFFVATSSAIGCCRASRQPTRPLF